MKVHIRGQNSKLSKREMRYAAQWMAHMLVGPRMSKSLTLYINNKPSLEEKFLGMVWFLDDNHNPRMFEMDIDVSKSRKTQLMTLAHEIVHVKQYAKGELKALFNKKENRWKGEYYTEDQLHYFDQPWEIEAFGREYGLFVRYDMHVKVEKVKFDAPIKFDPTLFS